jgi:DNA-binding CsgD family transcriptional regulator
MADSLTSFPHALNENWLLVYGSLKLNRREAQIIPLILLDCSEREIAAELNIKPSTLHTYLERLYLKLGVRGRVELVVRVFREYHTVVEARRSR